MIPAESLFSQPLVLASDSRLPCEIELGSRRAFSMQGINCRVFHNTRRQTQSEEHRCKLALDLPFYP